MRYALIRKADHIVDNVIEIEPDVADTMFPSSHRRLFAIPLRDDLEHAAADWRYTGETTLMFVPPSEERAREVFPHEDVLEMALKMMARPPYVAPPEPEPEPEPEPVSPLDALDAAPEAVTMESTEPESTDAEA